MRKVTYWLLWIFVFSIPCEPFISFEMVGTLSRVLGATVVISGIITILIEGRIRRPGPIFYIALVFTAAALLSLLWTVSLEGTVSQVVTYAQLLGVVCVVWEFARRAEEQELLMVAYCLGALVAIGDALQHYSAGITTLQGFAGLRYSARNFDPNDFGLTLALAIPMAWYLFLARRGLIKWMGAAYLPLASLAVLLTASRGAFLAGLVAVSIVPITTLRSSLRSWITVMGIILVAAVTVAMVVPESSWKRVLTASEEVSGGSVGGRAIIWAAGLRVFQDRPILGAGAGAFKEAVRPLVGGVASHNVLVAVLVEQGIAGLLIFVTLLGACARLVYHLPPLQRTVWAVIAVTWFGGAMSLDWQYSKVTWLLFALLAARAAVQVAAPLRGRARDLRDIVEPSALLRRRQLTS
jgi:O-antigen ligase